MNWLALEELMLRQAVPVLVERQREEKQEWKEIKKELEEWRKSHPPFGGGEKSSSISALVQPCGVRLQRQRISQRLVATMTDEQVISYLEYRLGQQLSRFSEDTGVDLAWPRSPDVLHRHYAASLIDEFLLSSSKNQRGRPVSWTPQQAVELKRRMQELLETNSERDSLDQILTENPWWLVPPQRNQGYHRTETDTRTLDRGALRQVWIRIKDFPLEELEQAASLASSYEEVLQVIL